LYISFTLRSFDLAFRFFAVYMQRRLIFSPRGRYMFRPNRPSSGVHFVVMKDSTAQLQCCSAFFMSLPRINSRLYGLTRCFIWVSLKNCHARVYLMSLLVACGCPECFCFVGHENSLFVSFIGSVIHFVLSPYLFVFILISL
jgi:hypothetical protein